MAASPDLAAWEAALRAGAAELGLDLPEPAVAALGQHFRLLQEHNARAGLTSLTDPMEIALKHYLDSLTCLRVHEPQPGEAVADLGSGGGFPGMVLAVVRPEAHYTLVDSSEKRSEFLRLAARELRLANITVVTARAEALGRDPAHREQYHLVTARALAGLPVLLEYGLPLLRVGGHMLAMKGPEVEQEVAAAQPALVALGGRVARAESLTLPEGAGGRTLLLIEKVSPTPPRYPRRPGMPAKRPLGG